MQQATHGQQPLVFAQLTKVDEAKRLVYGRAVQEVPDRVGELFDYESSKPLFEKWSQSQREASLGKSDGNLRAMHKDVAAGIIVPNGLVFHDDERAIDVCGRVTDDQEWAKVTSGTYTGFSIGGRYVNKWEDTKLKKTRYTGDPSEISLVDRPAVPTSTFFEIQKADGSTDKVEFARPKMTKVLRSDGAEVGEIAADAVPAVDAEFQHGGRTYQLVKVEDGVATVDEVFSVTGTPAELGDFAKLLSDKNLTIAQATEALKKAGGAAAVEPKAVDAKARELMKAAGVADDQVEAVAKDEAKYAQFRAAAERELCKVAEREGVNPKEGEEKYGEQEFADEKNKKYPLGSKEKAKAALTYWGMPKNRAKYSAEDQKTIGGKIRAAAKKFGVDVSDDSAGKAAAPADLRKGLSQCGQFAYLLDSLCRLADSVEMESDMEGDDSELSARMYNCCMDLGQCLRDMVEEECREACEGGEVDEANPPPALAPAMAMRAQARGLLKSLDAMAGATDEAVAAAAAELRKTKPNAPDRVLAAEARAGLLAKYGARHSKADLAKVQAVHDHAVSLGAMCKGYQNKGGIIDSGNDMDGKALRDRANAMMKAAGIESPSEEQLKKAEETIAMGSPLAKLQADNAGLAKRLADADERLAKQDARIRKLESQPLPARITVRAVAKAEDGGGLSEAERLAAEVKPVLKQDGSIDEVATATKMILRKGGVRIDLRKS